MGFSVMHMHFFTVVPAITCYSLCLSLHNRQWKDDTQVAGSQLMLRVFNCYVLTF